MTKPDDILVVLVTVASADDGAAIARALVEERLAACGNTGLPVRSVFRWEGTICDEPEYLLILKTTGARLERLTARIQELHSYDVPEIIALPVVGGSPEYAAWVRRETAVSH